MLWTNLEITRALVRVNVVPEALVVRLAAKVTSARLRVQSTHTHVVSHSHLLLLRIMRKLPKNMVRAANRRATTLGITANATESGGEFAAATTGSHGRAAVGAVFVAGGVGLDGDCPFGAELAVAYRFVEDEAVHYLALGVDVVEDFAHDFLASAAVEFVEGEADFVAA